VAAEENLSAVINNEHAPAAKDWLSQTLEEILSQIRRLLEVNGCAFQVVDWDAGTIRVAAAWFQTEEVREALAPILTRPYDPERPGVTEAAIERGSPLLLQSIEDWEGAAALHARLVERLSPSAAATAWEWYRSSAFISCPVRTGGGRTLGVLALSAAPPLHHDDQRAIEVFAGLAALALERSELLAREEQRAGEEELLGRAGRDIARSLEPEIVYGAIVDQAATLLGATRVQLTRFEPAAGELRSVASRGFRNLDAVARFGLDEGAIGEAARTGRPYLSREADSARFIERVVRGEGVSSFMHVPISLGPRLFGVLSAGRTAPPAMGEAELRLATKLAPAAAGAIANALDHQRERRVTAALTRGYVLGPSPRLPGLELGLVYEPAGHDAGGGDVFGAWTLPSGRPALLVGDVTGKGLELAALSAMVRFFVEARTWDCERPAEALAQTQALVRRRLPAASFVSVFMAVVEADALRWCNAGQTPPVLLRADGEREELGPTGLPLGVEEEPGYVERETPFARGDVLFAHTDGLSEARRDGEFFGEARLRALLGEHGRALPPSSLVERVHAELEAFAPTQDDDIVILAVRRAASEVEVRHEPPDGEAARTLFAEYIALVRSRLGAEFEPSEEIFATEDAFGQPGGAWLVVYEDGRAVACGGLRPAEDGAAELKRMFVTARARNRGHGRRLLAELEALARQGGHRRARLLTTTALHEARCLYASAGYRVAAEREVGDRRDLWLEKEL
jgi:GAF domain-containing protein/GNAT superfamily N-acetyltransferase